MHRGRFWVPVSMARSETSLWSEMAKPNLSLRQDMCDGILTKVCRPLLQCYLLVSHREAGAWYIFRELPFEVYCRAVLNHTQSTRSLQSMQLLSTNFCLHKAESWRGPWTSGYVYRRIRMLGASDSFIWISTPFMWTECRARSDVMSLWTMYGRNSR